MGEGEASPAPFWKSRKSTLILKKSVHPWITLSIQNVVLRVTRRKSSQIFPYGTFFSCVFNEIFIEVP